LLLELLDFSKFWVDYLAYFEKLIDKTIPEELVLPNIKALA
jgi:hypothetical protein